MLSIVADELVGDVVAKAPAAGILSKPKQVIFDQVRFSAQHPADRSALRRS